MYFQSNGHRGLMALAVLTTVGVFALPAVAQTTGPGDFGSVARANLILIRGGGGGGGHFGGGGLRGAFGHVGTSTLGSHAMANGVLGGDLSHMSRELQEVGLCTNPIAASDGEEALMVTIGTVELRTAV
jgi:hypothetical protein